MSILYATNGVGGVDRSPAAVAGSIYNIDCRRLLCV